MLQVANVSLRFDKKALFEDVNAKFTEGNCYGVIGANGAGKSTTLKAIAGLVTKTRNSSIKFMGEDITDLPPEKIFSKGISLAPEGRRIFPDHTVLENLEMGAYLRAKDKEGVRKDLESIFEMFPILEQRRNQSGKTLSGGEQQMLAIARALMANPKLLMLDEPSTGLAPLIIKDIFGIIKQVNEKGTTVLLVEQNSKIALGIADRGYVLKNGVVVLQDTCENLMKNEEIKKAYLGEGAYTNTAKG